MTDTKTPSVEVRDLDLHFGDVKVLQNLNIEIQNGRFLVLLGSSGCGKSTFLNCIAGLLDITGEQIFISGKNVTWAQPSERGIRMVFQSYALNRFDVFDLCLAQSRSQNSWPRISVG